MTKKIPFENQIHWIIIFGIVWGLLELFLNPILKSFSKGLLGITMPFVSVVFILSVKSRIPAKGTVFLAAIIASLIKYFFSGMVLTGGFMAILIEAALIDVVCFIGGISLWTYLSSAILVQLYSAFHPYITKGLLCQSTHFVFFRKFVYESFNLELQKTSLIFLLIFLHIVAGFLSGLISWRGVSYLKEKKN